MRFSFSYQNKQKRPSCPLMRRGLLPMVLGYCVLSCSTLWELSSAPLGWHDLLGRRHRRIGISLPAERSRGKRREFVVRLFKSSKNERMYFSIKGLPPTTLTIHPPPPYNSNFFLFSPLKVKFTSKCALCARFSPNGYILAWRLYSHLTARFSPDGYILTWWLYSHLTARFSPDGYILT